MGQKSPEYILNVSKKTQYFMNTLYHIRSPYHCYQLLLCLMYINIYVYIMYTLFRKWSYNEYSFNIFFSSCHYERNSVISYSFWSFLLSHVQGIRQFSPSSMIVFLENNQKSDLAQEITGKKKIYNRKRKKNKTLQNTWLNAISKDYTSEEKRPEVMPMWMCG